MNGHTTPEDDDRVPPEGASGTLMLKRRAMGAALLGAATAQLSLVPRAEAAARFPDHSLRMIVPFAPGGSTDICARLVAAGLGESLGQSVVVMNKAGGGTVIGTQYVADARPDGYTVLYGSNTFALNPTLRHDLPYDSLKDLRLVGIVARQPYVLAINPSVPATTVQQFVDYAKAHPGEINYGTAGAGTGNHLAQEFFSILSGTRITPIHYQGDGPMVIDLMANRVQMTISTIPSVYAQIQAGSLRALGVGDADPFPDLPGVPPISKAGVPGYVATAWNAMFVAASVPQEAVDRLSDTLRLVLSEPKVADGLHKAGAIPDYQAPLAATTYVRSEIEKWAMVIHARNIVLQ